LKNQFGMVLRLSAEAMKRREVITLLSSAATLPLVARAQPTPRRPIVAFVHAVIAPAEIAGSDLVSPLARAFVHGLRDLGWVEGRTIVIDRRSAEGQP
jgi:putative ABC transport system substrate-binding protein